MKCPVCLSTTKQYGSLNYYCPEPIYNSKGYDHHYEFDPFEQYHIIKFEEFKVVIHNNTKISKWCNKREHYKTILSIPFPIEIKSNFPQYIKNLIIFS